MAEIFKLVSLQDGDHQGNCCLRINSSWRWPLEGRSQWLISAKKTLNERISLLVANTSRYGLGSGVFEANQPLVDRQTTCKPSVSKYELHSKGEYIVATSKSMPPGSQPARQPRSSLINAWRKNKAKQRKKANKKPLSGDTSSTHAPREWERGEKPS